MSDKELWESINEIEQDEQALIEELAGLFVTEEREPGWVDATQMAKAWRVNWKTAKERLERMAEEGTLEAKQVKGPHGTVTVYRKKVNDEQRESEEDRNSG